MRNRRPPRADGRSSSASATPGTPAASGVSVPRALSKLGVLSRSEAERAVRAGRVRVDGQLVRDPARRVDLATVALMLDEIPVAAVSRVYVMLNKPRGLVTTRHDPQQRDTVYRCLEGADLPQLAPVGRLDKASEGLLLLTNDTRWASEITSPASAIEKVYHVQVDVVPSDELAARLEAGVDVAIEGGSPVRLAAVRAQVVRAGDRHGWLEIVLDEGRNRHIRRLLEALDVRVLRLIRVSIGGLALGDLPRGAWRKLTRAEVQALGRTNR